MALEEQLCFGTCELNDTTVPDPRTPFINLLLPFEMTVVPRAHRLLTSLNGNETLEDILQMQDVFRHSHMSNAPRSVKLVFKRWLSNPIILSALVVLFAVLYHFISYELHTPIKSSAASSGVVSCLLFLLYVVFTIRARSGWSELADKVAKEDLSVENGFKVYGGNSASHCFGVKEETQLCAMACLLMGPDVNRYRGPILGNIKEDKSEAVLTRVGVLPHKQGHGLGRAVVSKCLDYARECGVKTVYLITSTHQLPAVSLYRSFGFQLVKSNSLIPVFGLEELVYRLDF